MIMKKMLAGVLSGVLCASLSGVTLSNVSYASNNALLNSNLDSGLSCNPLSSGGRSISLSFYDKTEEGKVINRGGSSFGFDWENTAIFVMALENKNRPGYYHVRVIDFRELQLQELTFIEQNWKKLRELNIPLELNLSEQDLQEIQNEGRRVLDLRTPNPQEHEQRPGVKLVRNDVPNSELNTLLAPFFQGQTPSFEEPGNPGSGMTQFALPSGSSCKVIYIKWEAKNSASYYTNLPSIDVYKPYGSISVIPVRIWL